MNKKIISFLAAFLPNFIKIAMFRIVGASIGNHVKIGFGTIILCDNLTLDDNAKIGMFCIIKVKSLSIGKYARIENMVKITGYRVSMKSRSIIGNSTKIIGDWLDDKSVFMMGMHSWIFPNCYINISRAVKLGRNVGVGGRSLIFTHGYWLCQLDGFPVGFGSVNIGDDVWLPWDCFVMPGVTIGNKVIAGARSLINKDIADNSLVAGVPAKLIREYSFRSVTNFEKISTLTDSINEFAKKLELRVNLHKSEEETSISFSGKKMMVIHNRCPSSTSNLCAEVLNIFFEEVPKELMLQYPCFSLKNYSISSINSVPRLPIKWLEYARLIGMRYYPIDEMEDTALVQK